jgi:hypothetical protein
VTPGTGGGGAHITLRGARTAGLGCREALPPPCPTPSPRPQPPAGHHPILPSYGCPAAPLPGRPAVGVASNHILEPHSAPPVVHPGDCRIGSPPNPPAQYGRHSSIYRSRTYTHTPSCLGQTEPKPQRCFYRTYPVVLIRAPVPPPGLDHPPGHLPSPTHSPGPVLLQGLSESELGGAQAQLQLRAGAAGGARGATCGCGHRAAGGCCGPGAASRVSSSTSSSSASSRRWAGGCLLHIRSSGATPSFLADDRGHARRPKPLLVSASRSGGGCWSPL